MRIALVALLFSCLTLSGCGQNNVRPYETYSSEIGIGIEGYPACVGQDKMKWDNCGALWTFGGTPSKPNMIMWRTYQNGVLNGPAHQVSMFEKPYTTCYFTFVDGERSGWETCKQNEAIISKKFYVNGREDAQAGKRVLAEQHKSECNDLGFTPKTPEFGNCVLKLRELAQGSKPTTVIQSQPVQTAPTTADKIEGTKQILEAIQSVTTPAQSSGKQIDLSCVNVCQAQGKSLMYCRSDCAY
jgi:hypothetical protein